MPILMKWDGGGGGGGGAVPNAALQHQMNKAVCVEMGSDVNHTAAVLSVRTTQSVEYSVYKPQP